MYKGTMADPKGVEPTHKQKVSALELYVVVVPKVGMINHESIFHPT